MSWNKSHRQIVMQTRRRHENSGMSTLLFYLLDSSVRRGFPVLLANIPCLHLHIVFFGLMQGKWKTGGAEQQDMPDTVTSKICTCGTELRIDNSAFQYLITPLQQYTSHVLVAQQSSHSSIAFHLQELLCLPSHF